MHFFGRRNANKRRAELKRDGEYHQNTKQNSYRLKHEKLSHNIISRLLFWRNGSVRHNDELSEEIKSNIINWNSIWEPWIFAGIHWVMRFQCVAISDVFSLRREKTKKTNFGIANTWSQRKQSFSVQYSRTAYIWLCTPNTIRKFRKFIERTSDQR